jgi:hypothetical protein
MWQPIRQGSAFAEATARQVRLRQDFRRRRAAGGTMAGQARERGEGKWLQGINWIVGRLLLV